MNKILIIDGNSILNRGFYGIPVLTNSEGIYTNGVYGFLNIMFKFIEEVKPTHIAVAFDVKKPTFRHNIYKEYKGTRKGAPAELIPQFKLMREVLTKMKIQIFELEGYEADDILGTISKELEDTFEVVVLSGDKDTIQLASKKTKIMIPKTSKGVTTTEVYDFDKVMEVFGVTPIEFIDVKALMGDTSDNIPGVTGIGEKGALKIIGEYKSIENAIENSDKVKPKRASENLQLEKEQAILSKTLATINREVPIKYKADDLKIENFYNDDAIDEFLRLGFKSLLPKDIKPQNSLTKDLDCTIIDISTLSKTLEQSSELSIFTHIDNENVYVSISVENKNYIVDTTDFSTVATALKNVLENQDILKIFFDYKEFYILLMKNDLQINVKNFFDNSIAMYVINPLLKNYTVEELSWAFLNSELSPIDDHLGKGRKKKKFNELESDIINEYLSIRSYINLKAYSVLTEKLKEHDQSSLYYDIELPLATVLGKMEFYGFKVDVKQIEDFGKDLDQTIEKLTTEIYELAGEEFNINSPSQLGVILFEKLELKGGKKTKTGFSTSADILEKIKYYHPIVEKVLEYRGVAKLKSTYVQGLLDCVKDDSRIHSEFQQKVTATGRISSTNPNMQNLPIRSERGRNLRKGFITDEDYCLVAGDYSQIELRVLAHLADDEVLIDAFNNDIDIHKLTASQVYHCNIEDVTPIERSNAKAVNFGIVYGISSFSLSQDIKVTKKEADAYIEKYFETYKGIKIYLDKIVESAETLGYATTILNRIRQIPELKSSNFIQRGFGKRIAMNTPIQGSAADIIKIAMINVDKRLEKEGLKSRLILQIHDELVIETLKSEKDIVVKLLNEEMEKALQLKVKLEVDVHCGDSMYDLK